MVHLLRGVWSLLGWKMKHQACLYDLYHDDPYMPLDGRWRCSALVHNVFVKLDHCKVVTNNQTIQKYNGVNPWVPISKGQWDYHTYSTWLFSFQIKCWRPLLPSVFFGGLKSTKRIYVYWLVRSDPVTGLCWTTN